MTVAAVPMSFPAMGTAVEVLAVPDLRGENLARVRAWFDLVETALSRFRLDSELSMVNLRAGRPTPVSPLFREVLGVALSAAEGTGGLVDPTVLGSLEAAGYSVPFDTGPRESASRDPFPDYRRIRLCDDGRLLLPAGTGLDFGGVAKGWTVDRSARFLDSYESWLVNAGGDLLARGGGPGGGGWVVGIEDPFQPALDVLTLRVRDRAVATSSVMRRRWRSVKGEVAHHLIDPRTGRPSETDLASVTVIGRTVVEAETEAKALLLLGADGARRRAHDSDASAVLVDSAGGVSLLGGAGDYVAA